MPCVKPDVKGGQFSDLRTLFGRVGVHTHKISCESHHSRFRIQLTSSFFAMADGGKAASKEVNLALKAAKEAIKQKEYKEALKYCKNVLKIDKTNYHAWVFIGVCAKEMEQYDQSRAAYKKAIDQNNEQILAWQGLCGLYETAAKDDWRQELVEVYTKLISANKNDISKWREFLNKMIELQLSLGIVSEAVQYLKDLEGSTPEPSPELLKYWQNALNLLQAKMKETSITPELKDQVENAFQSVLEYSRLLGSDVEQQHVDHLRFLSNLLKDVKDEENQDFLEKRTLERGEKLVEEFPENKFAMEIVVRILLEDYDDQLSTKAVSYVEKLNELDPSNNISVIGMACIHAENNDWIAALNLLKSLEAPLKNDYIPVYWLLMGKIHLFLHDVSSTWQYVEKGILSVSGCLTRNGRHLFQRAFSICKAMCLIEDKKFEEAKNIFLELLKSDANDSNVLYRLGTTCANLGEDENAVKLCERILELQPGSHEALAIKALVSINEGKHYDAELRLQEALEARNDVGGYYFLLGKVYWYLRKDSAEYAKKAHTNFLKAAKLDPYNSTIFFYLGEFYKEIGSDLRRAQKCYHKALSLNDLNEEAALALGDISMDLGDEDMAVDVYEKVTSSFGAGRVKTAWLRLGMLLTKRGMAEKAVICFQSAIRGDPNDRRIWECLGDAYIARGSYMAAMKAFQRALEIDPSSLYGRYKIGTIKQLVCVYSEAIEEFRKLLADQGDYVPALKGLAECHLKLEFASIADNFDGRAVDHAVEVLKAASKAAEVRPDLRCFWKIIGDACLALDVLPEERINLTLPPALSKILKFPCDEHDSKKATLLDLSRRCYAMVVKLDEKSASAWHDLALSSFHFGMIVDGESGKNIIQQSVQFIKKAVSLDSQSAKMWNTLGVISGCSGPSFTCCGHSVYDIANPELSQHAFIKALQLEPQNAEAWTNLGALYLKYNKVQVAHEAFKKAQDADPSYTPAWVGQASIAEIFGDADAMDLFRHSSELGSHTECFLAYAKWVCFSLRDLYSKGKMNARGINSFNIPESIRKAIANASVCAQKYSDRVPTNPCAFNLLGTLLEHEALYSQSAEAFESAYQLVNSTEDVEKKNMVLSNHARVLRQSGQCKKSIEAYLKIAPLNKVDDVTGLALAYFFDGQLEQSLDSYEQALNLVENERDKSDILAAMGIVSYAMGKSEMAKSLLFKSSQTGSPSEQGLMALAAFGLLSRDHTLANAAIAEIEKHPDYKTESVEGDHAFLNSAIHLLQGDTATAKRHVQRVVKRYPHSAKHWNRLAKFICQGSPLLPLEVAGRCAVISSELQRSNESSMLISAAVIGSKSFASKLTSHSSHLACMRAAQKAVHTNPQQPENWALLSAAALTYSLCSDCTSFGTLAISTSRLALQKAEENLAHVQEILNTTISQQLTPRITLAINLRIWAIKQLIWSYLHDGVFDIAMLLSENAMSQYEENPDVCNELSYLRRASEIMLKISQGEIVNDLLEAMKQICDSNGEAVWKYQVLSGIYSKLGLPLVAELTIRRCVQLAAQNDQQAIQSSSLLRLALMSIWCFSKDKNDRWIALASEAINEATKLNPDSNTTDLLRVTLLHVTADTKKVKKILTRMEAHEGSFLAKLITIWSMLYEDEKPEIVDKDLYEVQNWT